MTKTVRKTSLACAVLLGLAAPSQAQEATILVLDGSRSMWGQIDGVNKIVIARDVVGSILSEIPSDRDLGLTVYGHRRSGDCSDIETIVEPSQNTRDQINAAVAAINPRGRTPMIDAVTAAAETLGYEDRPATVILVSDGVETCNADPCNAALALNEQGVDFTAHVVGFGVGDDPDALAQMQCIAENTGGIFAAAENADELTAALGRVTEAAPEVAAGFEVTFRALLAGAEETPFGDDIRWTIAGPEDVLEEGSGNPFSLELSAGSYVATAEDGEVTLSADFSVSDRAREVEIIFPSRTGEASIAGPVEVVAGSQVDVTWTGPDEDLDFIGIGRADAAGSAQWTNYAYTTTGNPVSLLVPPEPGDYVIRYFRGEGESAIASHALRVLAAEATVDAPEAAVAGDTIRVTWTGPAYPSDFIGIGQVGSEEAEQWDNFTYVREGSPLDLVLPTEPGDYVIQYFMNQETYSLVSVPIMLTPAAASLEAPSVAVVGETIPVGWSGPANKDDFVGIGKVDAEGSEQWLNYTFVREGNPLRLEVPTMPGEYVIRYFMGQDDTILAENQIAVAGASAVITAPTAAPAGEMVRIEWDGPGYPDDFIAIGPADAEGSDRWQTYAYTREGSPLEVEVPEAPGNYEIRYFLAQGNTELTSVPLRVE
ncbi:vWA domain-containing protein [Aestuariibius sp. 2305UL40-4]|uniref:vWA domain-containing protein n=1 Tax=Aestuariibius violaceus TaxID=3234132 RepID=UPI00345EF5EE